MNTITQLLEQGRVTLEAERERMRLANDGLLASKKAKFDREWAAAIAFLKDAWPMLADCIGAPEFKPDDYLDGQLPRGSFKLDVNVPSLDWFAVHLQRTEAGYQFDEPAIHLYTTWIDSSLYGGEQFLTRDKRNPITLESGSLATALALAQEYGQNRTKLALDIEQAKERAAANRADRDAKQAAQSTDAERALALVRELVDLVHTHESQE